MDWVLFWETVINGSVNLTSILILIACVFWTLINVMMILTEDDDTTLTGIYGHPILVLLALIAPFLIGLISFAVLISFDYHMGQ